MYNGNADSIATKNTVSFTAFTRQTCLAPQALLIGSDCAVIFFGLANLATADSPSNGIYSECLRPWDLL